MVRLPDAMEMTLGEFRELLRYAMEGRVVSCTGTTTEAVEDALDAVRLAAPNPPQALIDAARSVYRTGKR